MTELMEFDASMHDLIGKDKKDAIEKNLPMYIDEKGCTRIVDSGRLVKGSAPPNPAGRPKMSPVEYYLRKKIGWEGKEVFEELMKIATYDMKKSRHVKPHVNTSQKIEAAKVLLGYAFGKPKQQVETESTIKKFNINVNIALPDELDIEDIE